MAATVSSRKAKEASNPQLSVSQIASDLSCLPPNFFAPFPQALQSPQAPVSLSSSEFLSLIPKGSSTTLKSPGAPELESSLRLSRAFISSARNAVSNFRGAPEDLEKRQGRTQVEELGRRIESVKSRAEEVEQGVGLGCALIETVGKEQEETGQDVPYRVDVEAAGAQGSPQRPRSVTFDPRTPERDRSALPKIVHESPSQSPSWRSESRKPELDFAGRGEAARRDDDEPKEQSPQRPASVNYAAAPEWTQYKDQTSHFEHSPPPGRPFVQPVTTNEDERAAAGPAKEADDQDDAAWNLDDAESEASLHVLPTQPVMATGDEGAEEALVQEKEDEATAWDLHQANTHPYNVRLPSPSTRKIDHTSDKPAWAALPAEEVDVDAWNLEVEAGSGAKSALQVGLPSPPLQGITTEQAQSLVPLATADIERAESILERDSNKDIPWDLGKSGPQEGSDVPPTNPSLQNFTSFAGEHGEGARREEEHEASAWDLHESVSPSVTKHHTRSDGFDQDATAFANEGVEATVAGEEKEGEGEAWDDKQAVTPTVFQGQHVAPSAEQPTVVINESLEEQPTTEKVADDDAAWGLDEDGVHEGHVQHPQLSSPATQQIVEVRDGRIPVAEAEMKDKDDAAWDLDDVALQGFGQEIPAIEEDEGTAWDLDESGLQNEAHAQSLHQHPAQQAIASDREMAEVAAEGEVEEDGTAWDLDEEDEAHAQRPHRRPAQQATASDRENVAAVGEVENEGATWNFDEAKAPDSFHFQPSGPFAEAEQAVEHTDGGDRAWELDDAEVQEYPYVQPPSLPAAPEQAVTNADNDRPARDVDDDDVQGQSNRQHPPSVSPGEARTAGVQRTAQAAVEEEDEGAAWGLDESELLDDFDLSARPIRTSEEDREAAAATVNDEGAAWDLDGAGHEESAHAPHAHPIGDAAGKATEVTGPRQGGMETASSKDEEDDEAAAWGFD